MEGKNYHSGKPTGFQYGRHSTLRRTDTGIRQTEKNITRNDDDLIIDENTVYEIDRECYERLKRLKKREK